MLIDGKKVACATCIKGHRATHCKHKDRPMVEIKQKGRPKTQCKRCRELRLVRQLHVKCNCGDEKQLKRSRSTISSNNEQEARMIKKVVMDLSNTNLRTIAPRPNESQLQQQIPTNGLDLSSSPPPVVSPSSSSPPPLYSPPQYSTYPTTISSSPISPPRYSSYSISQSPPPLLPLSPRYSSYSTSSIIDSSSTIPSAATPSFSTSSMCRCRPGSSCGCKKLDGSTGSSCCGAPSSSQSFVFPSTPSAPSSSCGGSLLHPPTVTSSCGSSSSQTPTTSSCCGSVRPTSAPSSCCQSSPSPSSSLPPLRQLDSEVRTLTKSTSCCGSAAPSSSTAAAAAAAMSSSYDTNTVLDSSTQSMLQPSAHLTLRADDGRTIGTMCEDGIGKSSCCSSKQRNALGEIIRVVTCRCGDDCACIGCDAHPSRAMKSSQQDPYAGYTDLSMMGRRRLSIAAICSSPTTSPPTLSSSSTSSTSPPPPPPQQQQQTNTIIHASSMDHHLSSTPKYDTLIKPPSSSKMNDIPTSVLGEDGSLLCGCGCSNTLGECTDCFQELCQDYYSGR